MKSNFYLLFFFLCRTDTDAEHELIKQTALANGATDAVIARHWSEGGAGGVELANAVINACNNVPLNFHYLYNLNSSIEEKILKIATTMYGAGSVEYQQKAKDKIKLYTEQVRYIYS